MARILNIKKGRTRNTSMLQGKKNCGRDSMSSSERYRYRFCFTGRFISHFGRILKYPNPKNFASKDSAQRVSSVELQKSYQSIYGRTGDSWSSLRRYISISIPGTCVNHIINPHRVFPTTQKKEVLPWCWGWLGLVI